MLYRLKKYFPEFYNQFGCTLWFATCVLSFPLAFRAIFNALNYWDAYWDYWGENKYREAGYNFLLFFFGTYVPILAQISSLIFGFIRQKQVKIFKSTNQLRNEKDNLLFNDDNETDTVSAKSKSPKLSRHSSGINTSEVGSDMDLHS